jgi:hypothetical protein
MSSSPQTIFISIAAYCDPLLAATIQDAVKQAKYPENLRFGVVEQNREESRIDVRADDLPKGIRYLGINPIESRGACWARSLAMTLYEDENWFFQIDSHMRFDLHWDEIFLEAAQECGQKNPKFIISSYPHPFHYKDGEAVVNKITDMPLGHIVNGISHFRPENPELSFLAVHVQTDQITPGFHVGAGCLFAPGKIVYELPYDPFLYFQGEEQTYAARAFTHGWDIFHIPKLPVYHLYDWEGAPERPRHWVEGDDEQRPKRWWELDARSKQRFTALLSERQSLGIYSLGHERTLDDYAIFSGIDYQTKTISPVARSGIWIQAEDPKRLSPMRRKPSKASAVPLKLKKGKVGVMVPLSGRPDFVRLIALQLAAQTRLPDHVLFLQSGGFEDYRWVIDDLNLPFTYDWVYQEEQLALDRRYAICLMKLLDQRCDYFFWCDYDAIYYTDHISKSLEKIHEEKTDLLIDQHCDLLLVDKDKFSYREKVSFAETHAPGGVNSSMLFNRAFAEQLLKDLLGNSSAEQFYYPDIILAKKTAPHFQVHINKEKVSTCYISHSGSLSAAAWIDQLHEKPEDPAE